MSQIDSYRRKFLGGVAGTAAVATIAPGVFLREVQAKPANEAVTDKVRWGMLIDTSKLTDGGDACIEACKKEHGWGDDPKSNDAQQAQWILKLLKK